MPRHGVWKNGGRRVIVHEVREGFHRVEHWELGMFWTPSREINLLDIPYIPPAPKAPPSSRLTYLYEDDA